MEIPMKGSIEEQYAAGPDVHDIQVPQGENVPMTPEQAKDFLELNLPLMRLQGEYDRLMVEQLTHDALLNRRPINQIPGLLGMELKAREINAQQTLANYAAGLQNTIEETREREAKQKAVSIESGIQAAVQYNGENAGHIVALVKGTPIDEAQPIPVDSPDKRISFSVADTSYRAGTRDVSLVPTMWLIQCKDLTIWAITNDEYKTVTESK